MAGEPDSPALAAQLADLGIRPGQDLLVHSSLRQIGPVSGGAVAVLGALKRVVGSAATIVVPCHTPGNSLTSPAFRDATGGLSASERTAYIAAMPGFDPGMPSEGMGALAEHLRTLPTAVRGVHPLTSFAAIGPRAAECVGGHALDCLLGEDSPLGWLYRSGAAVLLLGTGYDVCTGFHLAEYRLPGPVFRTYTCFVRDGGRRFRREFIDLDLDDADFGELGQSMEQAGHVRTGVVGRAEAKLFDLRTAVDFAVGSQQFRKRRGAT